MSILEDILAEKRREVAERARLLPLKELEERAARAPLPRSLLQALVREMGGAPPFRVIAEIKKASPAKGVIRADFDAVQIARAYARAGASAISVLTDEKFFQGRLESIGAIRRAVDLPLLRKDFIIDRYQVWESRAAGADAILLILAAIAADQELVRLAAEAEALGMDVLWEVHDAAELERLLPLKPRLVGINNRNLRTFKIDLETTRALMGRVPAGTVVVSESGFSRREELEMMRGWGVGGFLIGESLMRASDPGAALELLLSPAREAPA